jgi:4-hydroxybenzoate polyprenyltransferase
MTAPRPRLLAYAQLVRLPNVFTAFADVGLGAFVAAGAVPPPTLVLLLLASGCLYCGGMVWNDYFDVEQDHRERPFRPLPSGRVSPAAALRLGIGLLAVGWAAAALAGFHAETWDPIPAAVGGLLVAAILLYDRWLKRTPAGPVGMGACRFLNVLLGLSTVDWAAVPWGLRLHLALVVGVYIVGVTWLARTEAVATGAGTVKAAATVMLVGVLLALPLPLWVPPGSGSPLFPYLLVLLAFYVGVRVRRATLKPEPATVQAAVKRAVLGLVLFDAVLATAFAGVAGLSLALLLPPALYLGQWLYST